MKGKDEKTNYIRSVGHIFLDYWTYFRYYFISPENCPSCQESDTNGNGKEK